MATTKGRRGKTSSSGRRKQRAVRLAKQIKEELEHCRKHGLVIDEAIPSPHRNEPPRLAPVEHSPSLHKLLVELLDAVGDDEFVELLRGECGLKLWQARTQLQTASQRHPHWRIYRIDLAEHRERCSKTRRFLKNKAPNESDLELGAIVDETASELVRQVVKLARKHAKRLCHEELRMPGAYPEFVALLLAARTKERLNINKDFAPVLRGDK